MAHISAPGRSPIGQMDGSSGASYKLGSFGCIRLESNRGARA